jgi:hypothetical protein
VERLRGRSIGIGEEGIGLQEPPPVFLVVAMHRRGRTASHLPRSVVRLKTHEPPCTEKGLTGLLALFRCLL